MNPSKFIKMKRNILLVTLLLFTGSIISLAQKSKDEYTETINVYYGSMVYIGKYQGIMVKTKVDGDKKLSPNGYGVFEGLLSGSGVRSTILYDNFDNLSNSSLSFTGLSSKSKEYLFNINPNDGFSFETSVAMQRLDVSTGGAKITIHLDKNNYLIFSFHEFKKETYNPETATLLDKTAFNSAKIAFNNIQISGIIAGSKIDVRMKPYGIDYTKFNKLKIIKNSRRFEVYVNDNNEGSFELSTDFGVEKLVLDKDDSHNVFYDLIKVDKIEYNAKDRISYSGNWNMGNMEGAGTLFTNGVTFTGNFIQNSFTGKGTASWNERKSTYTGDFLNGEASGAGELNHQSYNYIGEVKAWLPHGKGKMTIKSNTIVDGKFGNQLFVDPFFTGEFVNGNPKGIGKMTYVNGDTLVGTWEGLLFTGNGKLTLQDGTVYDGSWKNGKKEGKGKLIYSDGTLLVGDFINDGFNGIGKLKIADGGTYEGNIVMGKPSGSGTTTYPNGDKLIGTWNENGFNGSGKRTFEQIQNEEGKFCFEEGQWKDGKLNGNGKKVYQFKIKPDDEWYAVGTYTGQFNNGQFHGNGVLSYYNGFVDLLVEALWQNGQSINGKVTYTEWGDESKYVSYYTGELNGLGIANGSGTLKSSDGSVYVGQVKNGLPHGQGTMTHTDGIKQSGYFNEGEFEKTSKIGNQIWMSENLRVTSFRDGTPIKQVNNNYEWLLAINNQTPAWCYENFDPNKNIIYNFYVLYNKKGLEVAPIGWHIPDFNEFNAMGKYVASQKARPVDCQSEFLGYNETGRKKCEYEISEFLRSSSGWAKTYENSYNKQVPFLIGKDAFGLGLKANYHLKNEFNNYSSKQEIVINKNLFECVLWSRDKRCFMWEIGEKSMKPIQHDEDANSNQQTISYQWGNSIRCIRD